MYVYYIHTHAYVCMYLLYYVQNYMNYNIYNYTCTNIHLC